MEIPPFDVDALRDNAQNYTTPPTDPQELERVWRALIQDQLAAADHIDLCLFALRGVAA